jgi:hypothetical protein
MMAVLGKKKIGISTYTRTSGSGMAVGPFLTGEDGTITSISCYSLTGSGQFKLAVYEGTPGVTAGDRPRVAASDAITITQVGWQTAAATGNLVRGRYYWIAVVADGSHDFAHNFTEGVWWRTVGGTFSTGLPASWPSGASTRFRGIAIYLDYTPATVPAEDTSLQARINRAAPGSTVRIRRGEFNEHIRINKPLRLVGTRDRKGNLPVIQGGELVTGWVQSTKPEHVGKNVWFKDGITAVWLRSLQLNRAAVPVIQSNPLVSGDGATQELATTVRDYLMSNDWNDTSGHFLTANAAATINFWQWYEALAALTPAGLANGDPAGRLYLRLKTGNPNDAACYLVRSQHESDYYEDDHRYAPITISNTADVTLVNLEISGGTNAVVVENCSNVKIEKCKIKTGGLRGVFVSDSEHTTITKNEITGDWMQSNLVPGIGGASDKAKAGVYAWTLSKHYSIMNTLSPHGICISISGMSDQFLVSKNWLHQTAGGVSWGENILDKGVIYGTIENNRIENCMSAAIVFRPGAYGVARNNVLRENNIFLRIQDMGSASQVTTAIEIRNNVISTIENAGNLMQAHNNPGPSTWTSPVVFADNLIQTVDPFIANQLSVVANVTATGNVFDCDGPFEANTITHGMTSFTNNWVGGNAYSAPNQAWWGAGNSYSVNQRLPEAILPALPVLPNGFEEVGPYQQAVGLPVIRGDKTYGERFSG